MLKCWCLTSAVEAQKFEEKDAPREAEIQRVLLRYRHDIQHFAVEKLETIINSHLLQRQLIFPCVATAVLHQQMSATGKSERKRKLRGIPIWEKGTEGSSCLTKRLAGFTKD